MLLAPLAQAGADGSHTRVLALADMALSDLMQVNVSIATRKPTAVRDTPAAVFVLTGEDIRHSGATTIPEALRLVPGLDVARVDGHSWAVSARGFTNIFSENLLVMIDGRSVFTPLFNGVNWDVQDVMLEDVDHIEVIRGPGGSVWGANAVNGVINIITKHAEDTQGGLLAGGGGTQDERGFGALRYGGALGDNGYFRVYGKGFSRDNAKDFFARKIDNYEQLRGGFRADMDMANGEWTLQGDIYRGHEGKQRSLILPAAPFSQTVNDLINVAGGNILSRWTSGGLSVQAYYDKVRRDQATFVENRDTFDFDLKYHHDPFGIHDVQWGLGYRLTRSDLPGGLTISFNPDKRSDSLFSAFVQDEITLIPEALSLTLGSRFEKNDLSGYEFAPSARLLWHVTDTQQLWGAVSRAYVPPSQAEASMRHNFVRVPGFNLALVPNTALNTIDLIAYEMGYRNQFSPDFSVDSTVFINDYKDLTTTTTGSFNPATGLLPISQGNDMSARTYGAEVTARWQVFDPWRLTASWSWLLLHAYSSTDPGSAIGLESTPRNHLSLSSYLELPYHMNFDTMLYTTSSRPNISNPARAISAWTRVDLRLGWKPVDTMEMSVAVQNVFDEKHEELSTASKLRLPFGRSIYGKLTATF